MIAKENASALQIKKGANGKCYECAKQSVQDKVTRDKAHNQSEEAKAAKLQGQVIRELGLRIRKMQSTLTVAHEKTAEALDLCTKAEAELEKAIELRDETRTRLMSVNKEKEEFEKKLTDERLRIVDVRKNWMDASARTKTALKFANDVRAKTNKTGKQFNAVKKSRNDAKKKLEELKEKILLVQNEKKIRELSKKGTLVSDEERRSVVKTIGEEISRLEKILKDAESSTRIRYPSDENKGEPRCAICGIKLEPRKNCSSRQPKTKNPKCYSCAEQLHSTKSDTEVRTKVMALTKTQKKICGGRVSSRGSRTRFEANQRSTRKGKRDGRSA